MRSDEITNSTYRLVYPPPLFVVYLCIPISCEQERTTYAAVFRGGTEPYLQVVQLDNWDFTATSLTHSQLDSIKGSEEETHEIYDVDSRAASSSVRIVFGMDFL